MSISQYNEITASDVLNLKNPPGSVIWFSGNTGEIPSGYLVCNGQAVSRTTYANLYSVIGTKYGLGDESSTFNVPNLSDGNGRFIRAGFSDSTIGTKQDDAIRNITGAFSAHGGPGKTRYAAGALSIASSSGQGASSGENNYRINVNFNANNNSSSYGNPMAGYANGSDIHPYDIYFIPLISY